MDGIGSKRSWWIRVIDARLCIFYVAVDLGDSLPFARRDVSNLNQCSARSVLFVRLWKGKCGIILLCKTWRYSSDPCEQIFAPPHSADRSTWSFHDSYYRYEVRWDTKHGSGERRCLCRWKERKWKSHGFSIFMTTSTMLIRDPVVLSNV